MRYLTRCDVSNFYIKKSRINPESYLPEIGLIFESSGLKLFKEGLPRILLVPLQPVDGIEILWDKIYIPAPWGNEAFEHVPFRLDPLSVSTSVWMNKVHTVVDSEVLVVWMVPKERITPPFVSHNNRARPYTGLNPITNGCSVTPDNWGCIPLTIGMRRPDAVLRKPEISELEDVIDTKPM